MSLLGNLAIADGNDLATLAIFGLYRKGLRFAGGRIELGEKFTPVLFAESANGHSAEVSQIGSL